MEMQATPQPKRTSKVVPVLAIAAALAVGALLGGGAVWFLRDSPAKVTAKQFCALSSGSTLLEVGAWAKAAQTASDDWSAVQDEIGKQCPAWRDQVVAKSEALNP